jgi:phosphoglycerate dehydrogenase-like enzyme
VIVWIPATTPAALRASLPNDDVDVREYPAFGDIADAPQPADMLIDVFDPKRTIEMMAQLEGLKVVQSLSAGVDMLVDHIPPGVTLCDAAGVHDAPVSEWVVMTMLAMRRHLPDQLRAQERATWQWSTGGDDLEDATVLIVGHGSIGRALEDRLQPFGAHIERVARRARDGVHAIQDLPQLLPLADVVVILVPLTPTTRGMVNANFLASMREGALLVNAARGPIADTDALVDALRREHICAALDVTDPEPLPDGHPLWTAPGVLITPHTAGSVERLMERGWRLVGEQVRRYVAGEPLRNVVSAGY